MISDTSSQDTQLAINPTQRFKKPLLWLLALVVLLVTSGLLLSAWKASAHSVNAARLRIAEVTRSDLVRDASVNGRIVAAVSPTLYAPAPVTVTFKVEAGDTVQKGDTLALLESPDLADALKREQSNYQQLEAEVARQHILAKKQKLLAQREADTAEIERLSAQRTLERYESVAQTGIIAKIDYQKAKDALSAANIRAKHASQAAGLENEDVTLELQTKISQLQRQRLSLANAQRHVDELTVRAPPFGRHFACTAITLEQVNASRCNVPSRSCKLEKLCFVLSCKKHGAL
jgi:HlyD family secretion protein